MIWIGVPERQPGKVRLIPGLQSCEECAGRVNEMCVERAHNDPMLPQQAFKSTQT